jgi:hypothetical protein
MVNMLLTVLGNAHGLAAGTIGAAAQGAAAAAAASRFCSKLTPSGRLVTYIKHRELVSVHKKASCYNWQYHRRALTTPTVTLTETEREASCTTYDPYRTVYSRASLTSVYRAYTVSVSVHSVCVANSSCYTTLGDQARVARYLRSRVASELTSRKPRPCQLSQLSLTLQ